MLKRKVMTYFALGRHQQFWS